MDRRVNRTRNALVDALIERMGIDAWDLISVQQICDQADVSRSTFYTHFDNKDQLLDLCFSRLASELQTPDDTRGLSEHGTLEYLPNLISHVKSHCDLFRRNASSMAGQFIFNRFKLLVSSLSEREFGQLRQQALNRDQIIFINGGIFAMLEHWNENQCRETERRVLQRIDHLIASQISTPN